MKFVRSFATTPCRFFFFLATVRWRLYGARKGGGSGFRGRQIICMVPNVMVDRDFILSSFLLPGRVVTVSRCGFEGVACGPPSAQRSGCRLAEPVGTTQFGCATETSLNKFAGPSLLRSNFKVSHTRYPDIGPRNWSDGSNLSQNMWDERSEPDPRELDQIDHRRQPSKLTQRQDQ